MSTFRKGALFVPPLMMQCRHRGRAITRKFRPAHYDRRIYEILTQPILPSLLEDVKDNCSVKRKLKMITEVKEENEYEQFLLRQCAKMFSENRLIVCCQALSMKSEEMKAARNKLKKEGYETRFWSTSIMSKTIENTKWQTLEALLFQHMIYIVSPDTDAKSLVKVVNKIQPFVLLGGIVDDTFLSNAGLVRYANLPDIDVMRGELVSILNMGASKTSSLLNSHQQTLSHNLQQYIKDRSPEEH